MAPASRAAATTASGSSSRLNMDRRPPQPLHGHAPAAAGYSTPRAVCDRPEAVEEEAAAGHELHGVDPWRGPEPGHPGQQRRGLVPMSRTVVTPCARRSRRSRPSSSLALPFGEEEQVDVAVDQAGDQILPLRVDDPGALRDLAFARGAGAEDPVAADEGDGVGDRRAAGAVPQRGADDGGRGVDGGRTGPAWPGARHRRRPPGRPAPANARKARCAHGASLLHLCLEQPRRRPCGAANCPDHGSKMRSGRGGLRR